MTVTQDRVPPQVYFVVSAVFHYLGPAFAVLLFADLAPVGVAWLRIAAASAVFAAWRRPWRVLPGMSRRQRRDLLALGLTLATMNCAFYLAIARLPLATVGAIEFLGPVAVAATALRGRRNVAALALAVTGVLLLTDVRLAGQALGYVFAFANCALFAAYVLLGKKISTGGAAAGVDRLGLAMLVAALVVAPLGFGAAAPAFTHPLLLGAAIGVGICSSVIPYVCDQFALARLPRGSFALLLSLLPATATLIGIVVLAQLPGPAELAGIALVVLAVWLHRAEREPSGARAPVPPAERRAGRRATGAAGPDPRGTPAGRTGLPESLGRTVLRYPASGPAGTRPASSRRPAWPRLARPLRGHRLPPPDPAGTRRARGRGAPAWQTSVLSGAAEHPAGECLTRQHPCAAGINPRRKVHVTAMPFRPPIRDSAAGRASESGSSGATAAVVHDFDTFYATNFNRLVVGLLAYTADLAQAQDVAQEAFYRALVRWKKVSRYHDPVAWVRRVAWNLAASGWRHHRVVRRRLLADREESVAPPSPDRVALEYALAKLPANQRRAIVLYYLADMSVADIAAQEGAAEGTVRSLLHRGRTALAVHLSDTEA